MVSTIGVETFKRKRRKRRMSKTPKTTTKTTNELLWLELAQQIINILYFLLTALAIFPGMQAQLIKMKVRYRCGTSSL